MLGEDRRDRLRDGVRVRGRGLATPSDPPPDHEHARRIDRGSRVAQSGRASAGEQCGEINDARSGCARGRNASAGRRDHETARVGQRSRGRGKPHLVIVDDDIGPCRSSAVGSPARRRSAINASTAGAGERPASNTKGAALCARQVAAGQPVDHHRHALRREVVGQPLDPRGCVGVERTGQHDATVDAPRGLPARPVLVHGRSEIAQLGCLGGRDRLRARAETADERRERGHVDPPADARSKSARRAPDLPRHQLHRDGQREIELDHDRRPVTRAPRIDLARGHRVERHDDVGRQGADRRLPGRHGAPDAPRIRTPCWPRARAGSRCAPRRRGARAGSRGAAASRGHGTARSRGTRQPAGAGTAAGRDRKPPPAGRSDGGDRARARPGRRAPRRPAPRPSRREPRTPHPGEATPRRTGPPRRSAGAARVSECDPLGVDAVARAGRQLGDLGGDPGDIGRSRRELPHQALANGLLDHQALGHDEPRLGAEITHTSLAVWSSCAVLQVAQMPRHMRLRPGLERPDLSHVPGLRICAWARYLAGRLERYGKETDVMEPLAPPLPTFLIIGAQKSATRWLRLNLGLHPDVFAASRDRVLQQRGPVPRGGHRWYRAQFEGWAGEGDRRRGDARLHVLAPPPGRCRRAHRGDAARRAADRDAAQPDRPRSRRWCTTWSTARSRAIRCCSTTCAPRPPRRTSSGSSAAGGTPRASSPIGSASATGSSSCCTTTSTTIRAASTTRRCVTSAPTPDFVPPEFERVRFSHQQRPSSEPGRRPLTLAERRELWEYFAADVAKLERPDRARPLDLEPGLALLERGQPGFEAGDLAVGLAERLARGHHVGAGAREELPVDRRPEPAAADEIGDERRQRGRGRDGAPSFQIARARSRSGLSSSGGALLRRDAAGRCRGARGSRLPPARRAPGGRDGSRGARWPGGRRRCRCGARGDGPDRRPSPRTGSAARGSPLATRRPDSRVPSDAATSTGSRTTTIVVAIGVTVRQNGNSSERRGSFHAISAGHSWAARTSLRGSPPRARGTDRGRVRAPTPDRARAAGPTRRRDARAARRRAG